jgi:hypothetical protein
MFESNKIKITGHLKILDLNTKEVIISKPNAVNFENFAIALAQSISNRPYGWIQEMAFGNGGAIVSETGTITYNPSNVVGINAELYNETYFKVVDDLSPLNVDPTKNYIAVNHIDGTTYADVVTTCVLDLGEPAGQEAFDTATNVNSPYVFNELGLRSYAVDGIPGTGNLLTYVNFSPIQKSLNRQLEIVYTVRLQTV